MTKIIIAFTTLIIVSCGSKTKTNNVVANKQSTFKVWGNCEMCKETIEGSLKVEGMATADWNTETKIIAVSYDSTKINIDQIQKNIAFVGYDNEAYKGDDIAYRNLPECCQYERK